MIIITILVQDCGVLVNAITTTTLKNLTNTVKCTCQIERRRTFHSTVDLFQIDQDLQGIRDFQGNWSCFIQWICFTSSAEAAKTNPRLHCRLNKIKSMHRYNFFFHNVQCEAEGFAGPNTTLCCSKLRVHQNPLRIMTVHGRIQAPETQ